ncbi:hypothetical protein IDH70_04925 [Mixta calida]|nr:hypothetical protein IDH70_04925 [Mixta calida]
MMNQQTDKVIAELIQKAMTGVDQAVQFSKDQLPDVVEQLMHWKMVSYGMRIFTCALIFTAMCFLFRKSCSWYKGGASESMGFFGFGCSGLIGLPALIIIFANVGNLIQLWLAPKVWLIEYAAQLVSNQ